MSKRQEKELQDIFKDFEAIVEVDTDNMSVIQWQNKNGDMNHSMRFIIDNKKLIVTGDLGSNIFNWAGNGKLDMQWLSELGSGYFFSKRESKDASEDLWNPNVCKQDAKASITDDDDLSENEKTRKLAALEEGTDYTDYETQANWAAWINKNDNGETHFGSDHWEFSYNLGIDPDIYRHVAIFEALKGIAAQIGPAIKSTLGPMKASETAVPAVSVSTNG